MVEMYDQTQRIRRAIFEVLIRDYNEVMQDLNFDKYVAGMTFEDAFATIEETEHYFLGNIHQSPLEIEKTLFKEQLRGNSINKRYLERLYREYREGTLDIEDLLDKHKTEE